MTNSTRQPYGATPEEWDHFTSVLDLTHAMHPVASRPNGSHDFRLSDGSVKEIGKAPSFFAGERLVPMGGWPRNPGSPTLIEQWRQHPDNGFGLKGQHVVGLDIDDSEQAGVIKEFIAKKIGWLPFRGRGGSDRGMLAFRPPEDGAISYRSITTATGKIEVIGTGKQFVACGTHPSGHRYAWDGGLPSHIPTLSLEQFEDLFAALHNVFGTAPATGERKTTPRSVSMQAVVTKDETLRAIIDNNLLIRMADNDERADIICPWEDGHTTPSTESSTSYFLPFTKGFRDGSFVCQHAHCKDRTLRDLRKAVGLDNIIDEFPDGSEEDEEPVIEGGVKLSKEEKKRSRLTVIMPWQLDRGMEVNHWVRHILPRDTVGFLYGPSMSGKTYGALDLVFHLLTGRWWRGRPTVQTSVCYVAAEDADGVRIRLLHMCDKHFVDINSLAFYFVPAAPNMRESGDAGTDRHYLEENIMSVCPHGVGIIVVDTFASTTGGGDENSSVDMGLVFENCKALTAPAPGGFPVAETVMVIHHTGKDPNKGMRGWSGLDSNALFEIVFVREEVDPKKPPHPSETVYTLTTKKVKNAPASALFRFRLTQSVIGTDQYGLDHTACTVTHLPPRTQAETAAAHPAKDDAASEIMSLLKTPGAINGVAYITLETNVIEAMAEPAEGKADTRRSRFQKAYNKMVETGEILVGAGIVRVVE